MKQVRKRTNKEIIRMLRLLKKLIVLSRIDRLKIRNVLEENILAGPFRSGYNPELDLVRDSRDIEYGSVEEFGSLPENHLPTIDVLPDYQNGRPFCVGHSVSYLMRLQKNNDYSESFINAWAEYKENGEQENYISTYGTYIKSALWAVQHKGVCKQKYYPPTLFGGDWKKLAQVINIPDEANERAESNKINLYTRIGYSGWGAIRDPRAIQDAIMKYGGVIIGLKGWNKGWYQEYSEPSGEGPIWYHVIVFDGWKIENGKLYFRYANWWDPSRQGRWAGYGRGFMEWEAWRPHIGGAFTITQHQRKDYIDDNNMKFQKLSDRSKDVFAIQNNQRFLILNFESYQKVKPKLEKVEINPSIKSIPWGGVMIIAPDEDPLEV